MDILAWPKKHKWLSLLILLLIVVIGALAYDAIAYRLDKRAWFQAKESIDTIYADIIAKVGQPDDYIKYGNCRGFRGELGEENPINCEIYTSFIYAVNNQIKVDKLKSDARNIVNSHNDIWLSSQATSQNPFIPESEGGPGGDYYITPKNIECNAYYDFTPSFNTKMKLKDASNGNKQFYISLSCAGHAKGKYFSD
jgi:hypothetical protein